MMGGNSRLSHKQTPSTDVKFVRCRLKTDNYEQTHDITIPPQPRAQDGGLYALHQKRETAPSPIQPV